MKEYKVAMIKTENLLSIEQTLEWFLNEASKGGWELHSISDTEPKLLIFSREVFEDHSLEELEYDMKKTMAEAQVKEKLK